ncbi:MAG: hypothetical protein ACRD0W_00620 [Acidimicrobiales bacterium]
MAVTATITIPADGLRQLGNVALFADTARDANPLLRAVHLESTGAELVTVATDRYTAARETIPLAVEPGDVFAATVDLDGVKAALKIRRGASNLLPVTLTVNGESVTFDNGESLVRAAIVDGAGGYPKVDQFFTPAAPAEPQTLPVLFGADPTFLARLGKIRTEVPKAGPARITVVDPRKPILVQVDDTFQAVIMPVTVAP